MTAPLLTLLSAARQVIFPALAGCLLFAAEPSVCPAARIPPPIPANVAERLAVGAAQDLIVLFEARDVDAEVGSLRWRAKKSYDDDSILAVRRSRYRSIKQAAVAGFAPQEVAEIRDYDHLPMAVHRVRSRNELDRLLAEPWVRAVFEDRPVYQHLTYSLPFIGQPAVTSAGFTGSGQTVAVIDSGIDYRHAAFGSCSAPGIPAGCRVPAAVDVNGTSNLVTTANNHGTNVAAIVAGVATGARIVSFNAVPGGAGTVSTVIAGINWTIANKTVYGIGTLNMSLGDGGNYTAPCDDPDADPFLTPLINARSAGILPVASSGNNGYISGITSPACTPGVVSVGAVYAANWGGPLSWSGCTDSSASAPDKIPCFSNSASFLTMLAPGAFIAAADIRMAGTSQASPHVAGALAMMRAAYPTDTFDQSVARLTSGGAAVTDSRNGITKPRLNLRAALAAPGNDLFANSAILSGASGQITAHNLNATRESGEPVHAGNGGGTSVWWRWLPSVSGVATLTTHGSSFNTLLAVYGGAAIGSLNQVVANDNDGSSGSTSGVSFMAVAGNQYHIAVDGFSGASGGISLNWDLVQQADLEISVAPAPAAPFAGDNVTCTLTVVNHGPSAAAGVVVTAPLPAGVTFVSASSGCDLSNETVTCTADTLAQGSTVTIQLTLTTPGAGDLIIPVQVTATTFDPQTANNLATATLTVSPVDAAVPALSPWGIFAAALCLAGLAKFSDKRSSHRCVK